MPSRDDLAKAFSIDKHTQNVLARSRRMLMAKKSDADRRLEKIIDIHRKVDRFLKREAVSSGGWADSTPDEVEDLRELVDLLIKTKCQRDPDGDLPIECTIIDRRHYEGLHFMPVPYDNLMSDRGVDLEKVMELAELNLSIAHGSFKTKFSIWMHRRIERNKS